MCSFLPYASRGAGGFGNADIEPAERVDRELVAGVDHDRCRLGFNDRRSLDPVAGLEIVERVDVAFAPGAEEGFAPRSRLAGRGRWSRLRSALACRDRANGCDACIDEHDLLVARSVGVELFVPDVEAVLDVSDQRRRVEIDAVEWHVDLKNLLAITHLGGTLDLDLAIEPAAQPFHRALFKLGKDAAH